METIWSPASIAGRVQAPNFQGTGMASAPAIPLEGDYLDATFGFGDDMDELGWTNANTNQPPVRVQPTEGVYFPGITNYGGR